MAHALLQVTGDPRHERGRIDRRRIAAPRDVVIGTDQNEVSRVNVARFLTLDVEHLDRRSALSSGGHERLDIHVSAVTEAYQREVDPEAVEDGDAVGEPDVGRAGARTRARDVSMRIVHRRLHVGR